LSTLKSHRPLQVYNFRKVFSLPLVNPEGRLAVAALTTSHAHPHSHMTLHHCKAFSCQSLKSPQQHVSKDWFCVWIMQTETNNFNAVPTISKTWALTRKSEKNYNQLLTFHCPYKNLKIRHPSTIVQCLYYGQN
jgi:hypothetical protein